MLSVDKLHVFSLICFFPQWEQLGLWSENISVHPRSEEEGIKVPYLTKTLDVVKIKTICFSYCIGPYVSIYALDAYSYAETYPYLFLGKLESRYNWWAPTKPSKRPPTACLYSIVLTIPHKMACSAAIFCHENKQISSMYKFQYLNSMY